jgi:hypothetical protein
MSATGRIDSSRQILHKTGVNKAELERVIKEIRNYHEIGQVYLKQGRPYGSSGTAGEKQHRAKARAFANPDTGFTQQELNVLFNALRKENWAMPLCFVQRLISVKSKREREQIQAEAIRQRWSIGTLNKHLRERYGNRRPSAGRPVNITGLADAKDQLTGAADRWRRLLTAIHKAADAPVDGYKIPPALRRRLTAVDAAMEELKAFLEQERSAKR